MPASCLNSYCLLYITNDLKTINLCHKHRILEFAVPFSSLSHLRVLGFSGLFGPLLVCKKGSLDSDNKQKHYREFILHFVVTLEKVSWYYEFNKQQAKNTSTINEGMNFQFNSVH